VVVGVDPRLLALELASQSARFQFWLAFMVMGSLFHALYRLELPPGSRSPAVSMLMSFAFYPFALFIGFVVFNNVLRRLAGSMGGIAIRREEAADRITKLLERHLSTEELGVFLERAFAAERECVDLVKFCRVNREAPLV